MCQDRCCYLSWFRVIICITHMHALASRVYVDSAIGCSGMYQFFTCASCRMCMLLLRCLPLLMAGGRNNAVSWWSVVVCCDLSM